MNFLDSRTMSTKVSKSPKILIVDDNPRNIEVVASLLSGYNYSIEFAMSGEQAMEWVEKTSFDLILMDIMMPGINGYEACLEIKKKPSYKDIPVIFLTAKTDTESLAKAFEAGGVDYVSKPFRSVELLARVATHIELKQKRVELNELNLSLEKKVRERTRKLEEANRKLSVALKDLKELDTTKTDFLHMVSHELRTPLNGILSGLELLKMHEFPEEIKEYLEILDASTRRLEKFSYQALNISELQTRGARSLKMETFPLSGFLKTLLTGYRKSNHLEAGSLSFHSQAEGVKIKADRSYLQKAFAIILENAFEYSGGQWPVTILLEKAKGKLICTIHDRGTGFPDSMLKESMLSFSPGVRHTDRKTGLNLHFVQMIMRLFKGSLQLSNDQEGGATVRLIFPAIS